MPLPAFLLPTVGSFITGKGLSNLFGGTPKARSQEELQQQHQAKLDFVSQDAARRQALIGTGAIAPVPGTSGTEATNFSNVPAISGGVPGIPTRNAIGIGGDAALASTANVYRQQLAKQLGTEITNLNREFNASGRFDSGQRLEAIGRAQEGSREQFGRFFSSTALERFLQTQRLEAQAEIARAQLEQQTGAGRVAAAGQISASFANIIAQNPGFFKDLITRSGSSGFSSQSPGLEQYFDPNATTIQTYG